MVAWNGSAICQWHNSSYKLQVTPGEGKQRWAITRADTWVIVAALDTAAPGGGGSVSAWGEGRETKEREQQ